HDAQPWHVGRERVHRIRAAAVIVVLVAAIIDAEHACSLSNGGDRAQFVPAMLAPRREHDDDRRHLRVTDDRAIDVATRLDLCQGPGRYGAVRADTGGKRDRKREFHCYIVAVSHSYPGAVAF